MFLLEYLITALKNAMIFMGYCLLPWLIFACIMQFLTDSLRKSLATLFGGCHGFVTVTAPGVAVHELGHAFFCLVFGHKIIKMQLYSPQEDGTLGYVRHSYRKDSIYQRIGNFFIGTGPIWFGTAFLYGLSCLLLPNNMLVFNRGVMNSLETFFSVFFTLAFWSSWQTWIWFYGSFAIASHITLSPPDLEGAFDGAVALFVIVCLEFLLLGWWQSLQQGLTALLWSSFLGLLPFLIFVLILMSLTTLVCGVLARHRH